MAGSLEATVLYVSEFARPLKPGNLPGPSTGYQDLEGADAAAEAVAEQLERIGYTVTIERELSAAEIGERVTKAVKSGDADDLRIVHVVSHASVSKEIDKLHVVGHDSSIDASAIVEQWVTAVEFGPPTPRTLFVLDTCFAGDATVFPWMKRTVGRAPRALVVAASPWDDRAYDFRLSRALTDLLSNSEDWMRFRSCRT